MSTTKKQPAKVGIWLTCASGQQKLSYEPSSMIFDGSISNNVSFVFPVIINGLLILVFHYFQTNHSDSWWDTHTYIYIILIYIYISSHHEGIFWANNKAMGGWIKPAIVNKHLDASFFWDPIHGELCHADTCEMSMPIPTMCLVAWLSNYVAW